MHHNTKPHTNNIVTTAIKYIQIKKITKTKTKLNTTKWTTFQNEVYTTNTANDCLKKREKERSKQAMKHDAK